MNSPQTFTITAAPKDRCCIFLEGGIRVPWLSGPSSLLNALRLVDEWAGGEIGVAAVSQSHLIMETGSCGTV